jgi:hypothetical protein
MSQREWIGVDLDGTLARYDKWVHHTHIGEPITPMVERVKGWLEEGKNVKIFTARMDGFNIANPNASPSQQISEVRAAIEKWCLEHIGSILPITNSKDYWMTELWDDHCVQVESNTGRLVAHKTSCNCGGNCADKRGD